MCQTILISDSIVSLSKRSFSRRLRTVSSHVAAEKGVLTRLNNQLDELYELLYSNYPSMTVSDYECFKGHLSILIETLKALYCDYQHSSYKDMLSVYIENLCSNIQALEEIDNDIRNYKVRLPLNPRYAEVIGKAKML